MSTLLPPRRNTRRQFLACATSAVIAAPAALRAAPPPFRSQPVPVIYCSDLFHPHDDPDDHFDIAALYALSQLDVRGIVLDQGAKQLRQPGRIPVQQINRLTRRAIPCVIGLADRLRSPQDTGEHQPEAFQGGVRLILEVLRRSSEPVSIIAVGSLRDVVAAWNRDRALFQRQVARVLCFIGEARQPDFREYNVELDPQAYVGLMRSGLAVEWVPCFDGGLWQNRGHASFWKARHEALLRQAPPALVQFFIYALERETADPMAFLEQPLDTARRDRLFAGERNLWCTAVFARAAGLTVTFKNGRATLDHASAEQALFGFEDLEITISDDAVVRTGSGPDARRVKRFVVKDPQNYAAGMTAMTAQLYERFPLSAR